MTNGVEFLKSLQDNGWRVAEQKHNWECIDPDGKVFLYTATEAVKFGTWHDVSAVKDVPLPAFDEWIDPHRPAILQAHAIEFGRFVKIVKGQGWVPCDKSEDGARPDLNWAALRLAGHD
jgi:hypothetical protein